ncbi:MAG: polyribonucleotide nucleotidyltransferase, partial [Alphaproteobacteria bacterium]|nr:polyribonucleotide nucleotidyltransferase [Alphaproteobacteria bacterium]
MFDIHRKEIEWGGRTLTLETGQMARQADGSVVATYGDTVVLCTVVADREPKPGLGFFPLTVNYSEKYYAAGKIPGGFFKREGRPTEKETLTSRLIDRPIRPLFPGEFKNETQVLCTVLSHDQENDPDVVAMVGASAALVLSGIPFLGPIGGARVGYIDGEYVLNPYIDELPNSELDLIVAGTKDAVLMVESEVKELSEEIMLGAVMFGHEQMQPVIDAIISLAEECAKEPWELTLGEVNEDLKSKVAEKAEAGLREAYGLTVKQERQKRLAEVKSTVMAELEAEIGEDDFDAGEAGDLLKSLEKSIVRGSILSTKKRIDGRSLDQVRQIESQVGVLPRTHGSALFTRGETQSLGVVTLGTGDDEQIVDALEGSHRQKFMLHYNFPPFSVGEVRRFRGPGRREIGH